MKKLKTWILVLMFALAGSVKDADGGAAVPRAIVTLRLLSGQAFLQVNPHPAHVNADGSFSFPALPRSRQYQLEVSALHYGIANGGINEKNSTADRHEFPAFVLKHADRKLAGHVLDPGGRPIEGATVRLFGTGQIAWLKANTDSTGQFVFDTVCEGPVQLYASWTGPPENGGRPTTMSSASGAGIQAQAGDTNIVIQLRRPNAGPATIPRVRTTTAGTVLDPSGAPAAGVELRLVRTEWDAMAGAEAFTDANGKYSLQWQSPGVLGSTAANESRPPMLIVRDQTHNFAIARYLYTTNTNVDLRLAEGLSLSGRVQFTGGKPAGGFKVTLAMLDGGYRFTLDQSLTDAEGRFEFKGLSQEKAYSVSVNEDSAAKGYGVAAGILTAREARTSHYAFPAFVLKKANLRLAGYVLDDDHRLLPGAVVSFNGEGQPALPGATTDQHGHFAFDGVCEGPVTIFASGPTPAGGGVAATLNRGRGQEARAGDTNLVLTLGDKKPDADVR